MSKFVLANGATGTVLGGAVAIVAVVGGVLVLQNITKDQVAEDAVTAVAVEPASKLVTLPEATEPSTDTAVVDQAAPEVTETEPSAIKPGVEAEVVASPEPEKQVAALNEEQPEAPLEEVVDAPDEATENAVPADVADGPVQEEPTANDEVIEEPVAEAPAEVEEAVQAEPVATLPAPSFDLVRIEADGSGMVAGQAAPGSVISILLDGQVIETASVDRTGKFAAFVTLESSSDPRFLTLNASLDGQDVTGPSEVIIAPIAPVVALAEPVEEVTEKTTETTLGDQADIAPSVVEETAAVEKKSAPEVAEQVAVAVETPSEPVSDAKADEAVAEAEEVSEGSQEPTKTEETEIAKLPAVPAEQPADAPALGAVILSGPEGVKVLQSGGAAEPVQQDFVALDAITYADDGSVEIAGRGTADGVVNLYLNNALIANADVDRAGAWGVRLDDVEAGTYTLRMDRVDENGKVLARIESPFRREDQQALIAATPETQGARAKAVTVQPGNTLWAIAREQFGDGVAYVRLFEANRDLIRDPDLIYPGQVFAIPE